jgi:hypothetical protein
MLKTEASLRTFLFSTILIPAWTFKHLGNLIVKNSMAADPQIRDSEYLGLKQAMDKYVLTAY